MLKMYPNEKKMLQKPEVPLKKSTLDFILAYSKSLQVEKTKSKKAILISLN